MKLFRLPLGRKPGPALPLAVIPWLMATALATLAPHAEHFPPWLNAGAAALLLWRIWMWRRGTVALAAGWLIVLAAAGCAAVVYEYRTLFGREPGVALLAVLMALKLLELRSTRDGVVIVMLAYFLLLTHYFNADGLSVGIWMLFAITVTTASLTRLQAPDYGSNADSLRLAAALVLQALPIMAVLFVLFPRISGPLWGLPQDLRRSLSGLSDEMSPGSISEVSLSAALAFRVEFAGPVPEKGDLYWRGPVMTDYDGRTWRAQRGQSARDASQVPKVLPRSTELDYTITLEPHQQRWLLALDLPTRLPPEAYLGPSLTVLTRAQVRDRVRLKFASATRYQTSEPEHPANLQRALALPPQGNPQARALAREWADAARRDGRAVAQTVAARALIMFREQGFAYTLRPPLLGENPIDEFLFDARRGFCEHYSAAFVFLMRAAGVPARVVGGYQGGELNPLDGVLTVRQSDAHAWAEIWISGQGWVRHDPTAYIAPNRVEQGLQAALPEGENIPPLLRADLGWLRELRFRWDLINNAWNIWVIGYDSERQRELLRRFGLTNDGPTLATLLAIGGGAVGAVLFVWLSRRPRERDRAQRLWNVASRRLGRFGAARRPDEGPEDYARRVASSLPRLAGVTNDIATLYIRARYAGDDRAATLAALATAVRRLPVHPMIRSHLP